MQRGRGGGDDFFGFGDPFAGFGGLGRGRGSLISSFFGGRDPFDNPFFARPFGSMMGPSMFGPSLFGSSGGFVGEPINAGSMMGPSMFGPSLFGSSGGLFGEPSNAGFLEQQAPPLPTTSRGPIITELSSDGEDEEEAKEEEGQKTAEERKDNPRKHARSSKGPYIQDPDDEVEEKKSRHMTYNRANTMMPQSYTCSFQSSTVTYGGPNGAYYTSSTTRRAGGDGVVIEENKEADTSTRKATHRISRGIHDKGHSLTRKLNPDGRVDSVQTLHNLNEDELSGFDEAWRGRARQHFPGWNHGVDMLHASNAGRNDASSRHDEQSHRGWALPSPEQPHPSARVRSQPQSRSFGGRGQYGQSQP